MMNIEMDPFRSCARHVRVASVEDNEEINMPNAKEPNWLLQKRAVFKENTDQCMENHSLEPYTSGIILNRIRTQILSEVLNTL